MKASSSNQSGFTLVETVAALLVMMIVGLGAAAVFVYAINNNTGAGDRAMALAVAQQRLEQLRRLPYNDAALNISPTPAGTAELIENAGRTFLMRTTVQNAGACAGCAAVKIVTIRVWPPSNISQQWASQPITMRMLRPAPTNGPYARS